MSHPWPTVTHFTATVPSVPFFQGAQGPSGPPGAAGARGMPVCNSWIWSNESPDSKRHVGSKHNTSFGLIFFRWNLVKIKEIINRCKEQSKKAAKAAKNKNKTSGKAYKTN